tara:strand:+ start:5256 stop:5483 length:228 start_codon:yes stop_codon:yes gene_type:complete
VQLINRRGYGLGIDGLSILENGLVAVNIDRDGGVGPNKQGGPADIDFLAGLDGQFEQGGFFSEEEVTPKRHPQSH